MSNDFTGVPKVVEKNLKLFWIISLFLEFAGAVLLWGDIKGVLDAKLFAGITLSLLGGVSISICLMAAWNNAK